MVPCPRCNRSNIDGFVINDDNLSVMLNMCYFPLDPM
jgi:hypothetical protein